MAAIVAGLLATSLAGFAEVAHADEPSPVEPAPAEPPVETGDVDGATVAVGAPPVPVAPTPDVAVGLPPVPPVTLPDAAPGATVGEVLVAVGAPPVVPHPVPDAPAGAGHAVNVPSHGSQALVAGGAVVPTVLPATRAAAAAAASASLAGSLGSFGVLAAIAVQG